jgi:K(+)-stimulated pyrophosphate-energized sodium pump
MERSGTVSATNQESLGLMWMAIVIGIGVVSLIVAVFIAKMVLKKDTGTDAMRAISDAIREGAEAFMSRQYRTIGVLAGVLAVVIFVLYGFVRELNSVEKAQGLSTMGLAIATVVSFILGALCSAVSGYIGMWIAIRTNIRTASAGARSRAFS